LEKIEKEDKTYFKVLKNLPRKKREKAFKKLEIIDTKIKIPIIRCEKPKFGGKGRTWEFKVHNLNNKDEKFHFDTSWGNYMYFSAPDDRWYKINILNELSYNDPQQQLNEKGINMLTNKENINCKLIY
jgi:hypothetical protein